MIGLSQLRLRLPQSACVLPLQGTAGLGLQSNGAREQGVDGLT